MNDPKAYQLFKQYVLFAFKNFYKEIIIKGEENLPKDDSAIIFAPNHLNALMDALAASYIVSRKQTVVYLARADLFRNNYLSKIMHFVNILPAFRMRDGIDNLNKNTQSFSSAVDALEKGKYVCIMPEGGQGEERNIRPLVKGIFRIAFTAQEKLGDARKVKIIPIGLDFDDLEKSNTSLIINIGEAIAVDKYYNTYIESSNSAINEIRQELHQSLADLTRNFATTQYYKTYETISTLIAEDRCSELNNDTWEAFQIKQIIGNQLLAIEKDQPKKMDELQQYAEQYTKSLKRTGLNSIAHKVTDDKRSLLKKSLALLITLPLFMFGFITNLLPYAITKFTRKALSIEYSGFNSSVSFVLAAIFFPIFYIVQTIVFHKILFGSFIITILFLLLQYFTRGFTLKWLATFKELYQLTRFNWLLTRKGEKSTALNQSIFYRNKIISSFM